MIDNDNLLICSIGSALRRDKISGTSEWQSEKPDKETRAWIQILSRTVGNIDEDDMESLWLTIP